MQGKRRLSLAGVLVAAMLCAGCPAMILMSVGGAAALGSYKWMEGTMEKDYPRSMQDTYNAAQAAAKQMNLRITGQQYGPTESKIDAVTTDNTTVKITLVARPNTITTLKVRFGLMGNADYSAYYHRLVMRQLGIPDQP
jgi:hypothetical protein